VPFGKVVSGLGVVEQLKAARSSQTLFETVTILTESDYLKAGGVTETATDDVQIVTGNPEAVIKTNKGDLRVTLYEDTAPNTVSSFISLAEQGFYDKGPGEEKQKFFRLEQDAKGKILIIAGSPTNDFDGDPGYRIPDEVRSTSKKCVKGALVMTKMVDEESGSYLPDSAGSQFFICLRDIPAFNYQPLTVFGTVTGNVQALDQLEEGDAIETIKITKKKRRSYDRFRKVPQ
jgi:peptidyl-prolyl cis-trans isomerase B (cyclophilin B)